MALWGGSTQEALGLHIDGHQVQVAYLRREGDRVFLVGLDSATLVSRLDLEQEEEAPAVESADPGDILGLTEEPEVEDVESVLGEDEDEEEAPETNTEVLYALLNKFPIQRCRLAVSLVETSVFFSDFEDSFGLKVKALKKRLMEEAEKERTSEGAIAFEERHAFFQTHQEHLLSIVHEDPLEILTLLDELKPFLGRVRIRLIDPLEITLMNLVRRSYPPEEQVTAIVFVGEDSSRVVFMQNGDYLAFSQPIHEGFGSDQVVNTVYSRILFEQDVADLPEIGRVILTGGCRSIDAQAFFAEQFPNAEVDYLSLEDLDPGELAEQDRDLISNFAVPIGLAWKTLRRKEDRFYPSNFLPKARRRHQNPFELAWHGLVLIVLIVVSVFFWGLKARDQDHEIDRLRLSVSLLEDQVRENQAYIRAVDSLHTQIGDYERNFALIDTLSDRRIAWSPRLSDMDEAVRKIGGLWLERFSTSDGDIDVRSEWAAGGLPPAEEIFILGTAAYRDRVPKISERFGNGNIRSVFRARIRGRTVYEFDLTAPIASPE